MQQLATNPVVRKFFFSPLGNGEREGKRSRGREWEVQSPGHPMALSSRAGAGAPGRHCAELLLTWFRIELPITFSLGLTLESPPPLPHSPLSYHHLFFNLSNRPCSFSFSTARLTAFLETIKHTRQTGWANLRRFVCFVLICFFFFCFFFFFPLASVATLVTKKWSGKKATRICNYELRISWIFG